MSAAFKDANRNSRVNTLMFRCKTEVEIVQVMLDEANVWARLQQFSSIESPSKMPWSLKVRRANRERKDRLWQRNWETIIGHKETSRNLAEMRSRAIGQWKAQRLWITPPALNEEQEAAH